MYNTPARDVSYKAARGQHCTPPRGSRNIINVARVRAGIVLRGGGFVQHSPAIYHIMPVAADNAPHHPCAKISLILLVPAPALYCAAAVLYNSRPRYNAARGRQCTPPPETSAPALYCVAAFLYDIRPRCFMQRGRNAQDPPQNTTQRNSSGRRCTATRRSKTAYNACARPLHMFH